MMSSGNFPDPREVRAFRRDFIDRWIRFLNATFASKSHAAIAFARDESTVRGWLSGVSGPSGDAVALAFRFYPVEAAKHLLGGCLGRLIPAFNGVQHGRRAYPQLAHHGRQHRAGNHPEINQETLPLRTCTGCGASQAVEALRFRLEKGLQTAAHLTPKKAPILPLRMTLRVDRLDAPSVTHSQSARATWLHAQSVLKAGACRSRQFSRLIPATTVTAFNPARAGGACAA